LARCKLRGAQPLGPPAQLIGYFNDKALATLARGSLSLCDNVLSRRFSAGHQARADRAGRGSSFQEISGESAIEVIRDRSEMVLSAANYAVRSRRVRRRNSRAIGASLAGCGKDPKEIGFVAPC